MLSVACRNAAIMFSFLAFFFSSFSYAESPVKVSLSFEMLKGLPEDIHCLKRVESVFDTLEIEDVPWKRIMFSLKKGTADLTPCVFKTPAREEFIDFYGPIAALPIVMVSKEGRDLKFSQVSLLSGVFLRGTSLVKKYTNENMEIFETSNIQNILDILRKGRADYSLMPKNFVNARDMSGLTVSIIDYIPLYIGVSKQSLINPQILHMLSRKVDVIEDLSVSN